MELCEEAISESNEHGEKWHKAEALADLSTIVWRQGDTRRASELAAEGLRIQRAFDNAVGTAQFLEILAWIAATEHRHPRAARLLGAADEVWHAIDASLFPYLLGYRDETEKAVRRALGARAFETDYRARPPEPPTQTTSPSRWKSRRSRRCEPTAARSASSPGGSGRSPTSSRTA